jgi:16S rRNA (cytosine1402-N4)-methyltransferase
MEYTHTPVMLDETIQYLNCHPGAVMVDCTIGGAGHAKAILSQILPNGLLIGIDQDKEAIIHAQRTLQTYKPNFLLFHDNFSNLQAILHNAKLTQVDGIIADLGFSFHQIENSGRGFSFRKNEPLDMRMNTETDVRAEALVNDLQEKALVELFQKWGEERFAKRIAKAIVKERKTRRIVSSDHLARIVAKATPIAKARSKRIHPATRTFMALRIAVNRELDHLQMFLNHALEALKTGGRLGIISFHSLEDRMVKHRFKDFASGCTCPADFPQCVCGRIPLAKIISSKALKPSPEEIQANPMARSARLRVVEKRMATENR